MVTVYIHIKNTKIRNKLTGLSIPKYTIEKGEFFFELIFRVPYRCELVANHGRTAFANYTVDGGVI